MLHRTSSYFILLQVPGRSFAFLLAQVHFQGVLVLVCVSQIFNILRPKFICLLKTGELLS